jgi:uncharacterized protein (DUF1330 family)
MHVAKTLIEDDEMAAYVVMIRDELTDQAEMKIYAELAPRARAVHPCERLVAYGDIQSLEGEQPDGVVVLRFETMEAAKAWYDSEEYQAALPHRHRAARYQVFIAAGV